MRRIVSREVVPDVIGVLVVGLAVTACADYATQPVVEPPNRAYRVESVLLGAVGDAEVASNAFAGTRPAVEGTFTLPLAQVSGGDVEGQVAHVGRGCPETEFNAEDPYLADPAGKIALIERGVCEFVDKVARAQAAGAVAVIVYNFPFDNSEQLVRMGPSDAPTSAIPGVFVARSTGLLLRDGSAPVTATVRGLTTAESLEDAIGTISQAGLLAEGQVNALLLKLSHAEARIADGQYQSALGVLNAFINQVSDLVGTGQISSSDGAVLISLAQELIDSISP